MHSSRANGFDGPNPIAITDIANWSALTGTILRREEVAILRQIDVSYIVAIGQEHAEEAARAKDKTK